MNVIDEIGTRAKHPYASMNASHFSIDMRSGLQMQPFISSTLHVFAISK